MVHFHKSLKLYSDLKFINFAKSARIEFFFFNSVGCQRGFLIKPI